jgi:hypothetical protein
MEPRVTKFVPNITPSPQTNSAYRARILEALKKDPPPPVRPLSPFAQEVWNCILNTRAPSEWTGIDAYLATELCELMEVVFNLSEELRMANYTDSDANGNARVHPLEPALAKRWTRILQLQNVLRISADYNPAVQLGSGVAGQGKIREQHLIEEATFTTMESTEELLPSMMAN